MNTNPIDAVLSQTVGVSGYGLLLLALFAVWFVPFVIARRPRPAEDDERLDETIHRKTGNLMWWMIFLTGLAFAIAIVGEVIGIDTLSGVTPR
jgi:hypothetical protein